MYNTVLKLTAAYFLIQSWLFYEACSSPINSNHLPKRHTNEDQALADILGDSKLGGISFNTSTSVTPPPQKHGSANIDNYIRRLKRSSRPCELRRKIKWNHCLGRRFTEIHCRTKSKACLAPNNLPPKCKTHMKTIPGKNGYCPVVTKCTCAE